MSADNRHTWIFAVQRVVMAVIFEPDTPGGLRLSIDCRIESSSATAEDMMRQQSFLQLLQEGCELTSRQAAKR